MDFLQKHPTPWEFKELISSDCRAEYEAVVDASGQEVFATIDGEGYASWFIGDINELVDWVNALGGSK